MEDGITFVLTSCGRFDLLQKTLESFFAYNDMPIDHHIIIEDSGREEVENVIERFPIDMELIINQSKLGQMASIDRAYARVTTPYIFHCEDDWHFSRKGIIKESMELLKAFEDIVTVGLRKPEDMPPEALNHDVEVFKGIRYRPLGTERHPEWFGMSFNPGLRRLKDYERVGAYSEIGQEHDLSLYYKSLGYRMIMLEDGGVTHLGSKRTVRDPYQSWRPITRRDKWVNSIRKRLYKYGLSPPKKRIFKAGE